MSPAQLIELRSLVGRVLTGERLVGERAVLALDLICAPNADLSQQVALLAALRARGEQPGELADLARALVERARGPIERPGSRQGSTLVDTCGTGGDGSNSINISTLAALVVAAAGVPVAKHGNRSVSSRCGSADLIEALGIPLAESPEIASEELALTGFTFLFAPAFHPAVRAVGPARRALATRTVFNLLGPLVNPARPTHQVLGACDESTAELMAAALASGDVQRAFVVHGSPGWDEATPCGPFLRFDVRGGSVRTERLDPLDYGLERCAPEDLAGGDAEYNADVARAFLGGARGPVRDTVLLNAALVFELIDPDCRRGAAVERGARAVDDGRAARLVEALSAAASGGRS